MYVCVHGVCVYMHTRVWWQVGTGWGICAAAGPAALFVVHVALALHPKPMPLAAHLPNLLEIAASRWTAQVGLVFSGSWGTTCVILFVVLFVLFLLHVSA
jgi:hypothetical protein